VTLNQLTRGIFRSYPATKVLLRNLVVEYVTVIYHVYLIHSKLSCDIASSLYCFLDH